jgi:hypothetical protein
MNTVNVKKRWMTIYWRVNKFLKESHIVTRLAKERPSFLNINNVNDISFYGLLTVLLFYSVSGNTNSMHISDIHFVRIFVLCDLSDKNSSCTQEKTYFDYFIDCFIFLD